MYTLFTHCAHTVHVLKNIKNGSHNTIYTFKYYFATVFSVFSFQFSVFSNNKFNPNTPITFPEKWQLETVAPTPKIENTEPNFIAQNIDGTVIISFNNNDRHTNSLIRPSSSTGRKTPMMFTPRSSFSSRTPFSDSGPLPP